MEPPCVRNGTMKVSRQQCSERKEQGSDDFVSRAGGGSFTKDAKFTHSFQLYSVITNIER